MAKKTKKVSVRELDGTVVEKEVEISKVRVNIDGENFTLEFDEVSKKALELLSRKAGLSQDKYLNLCIQRFVGGKLSLLPDQDGQSFAEWYGNSILNNYLSSDAAFGIDQHIRKISISMRCTYYDQIRDPLVQTLPSLIPRAQTSKSSFLRKIFNRFLIANGVPISKQGRILEEDIESVRVRLLETREWLPYGWQMPLSKLLSQDSMPFRFLKGKRGTPAGTYLKYDLRLYDFGDDDPVRELLPNLCRIFFRDYSDFFKMITMYYLQALGLVDEKFELFEDYERRLEDIDLSELIKTPPL